MSEKNLTPENEDTQLVNPVNATATEDTRIADEPTQIVEEATKIVDEPTQIVENKTVIVEDAPVTTAPATPKKNKSWMGWLIGAIVVIAGGGVGYYFWQNSHSDPNADADHSDDSKFENFGDLARDLVRATGNDYSYNDYDDYDFEEVVVEEAAPYDDYYDYAAPAAEEAVEATDYYDWDY